MHVLVTGATGLLGGEVIAQLLRAGHSVLALTHRQSEITDNAGHSIQAQNWTSKPVKRKELLRVWGDITKSDLGLSQADAKKISDEIDLVIHCAALTAFDADPESHRAINVEGTANLLRLVPQTPILHVSTAYVCGNRQNNIREEAVAADTCFTNGYEASKAIAETLVQKAPNPSVIARPSIIVGAYDSGEIGSFDNFYMLFKWMAEGRIRHIPFDTDAGFNFVPIDHVVGGLMDIIAHWKEACGGIFHLTGNNAVKLTDFMQAMADNRNVYTPQLTDHREFDDTQIPARERRLNSKLLRHYLPYFLRSPNFENTAITKLSGRECPNWDAAALARQISYCIDSGFISKQSEIPAIQRISG